MKIQTPYHAKVEGNIVCDIHRRARARAIVIGTALVALAIIFASCANPDPATENRATPHDDGPIGRAFASGTTDVQVECEGTVISILSDDVAGSRHQRFIVQLASGQTLLITHNIDLAQRIAELKVGDTVWFNGEYVWNEKAVSSIGHTMTHRVGMSQAGLYIKAKDISNDSVWTRTFATSSVIA
jgi:hypothetical protein